MSLCLIHNTTLDKSFISEKTILVLNCKKNIALKISYKIVALFTENYPSTQTTQVDAVVIADVQNCYTFHHTLQGYSSIQKIQSCPNAERYVIEMQSFYWTANIKLMDW